MDGAYSRATSEHASLSPLSRLTQVNMASSFCTAVPSRIWEDLNDRLESAVSKVQRCCQTLAFHSMRGMRRLEDAVTYQVVMCGAKRSPSTQVIERMAGSGRSKS